MSNFKQCAQDEISDVSKGIWNLCQSHVPVGFYSFEIYRKKYELQVNLQ